MSLSNGDACGMGVYSGRLRRDVKRLLSMRSQGQQRGCSPAPACGADARTGEAVTLAPGLNRRTSNGAQGALLLERPDEFAALACVEAGQSLSRADLAALQETPGGGASSQGVSVSGAAHSSPIPAGSTLPQFTAPALGGGQISWASYRGGPTVLILWAPWCAECERELPIVAAVARQFPAVRLTSIVTAVGQEPGPTPAQYMCEHGYTFPVAFDSQAQELADAFGLTGYPLIYYVYSDGIAARATIGVAPANVVRALMAQIAG